MFAAAVWSVVVLARVLAQSNSPDPLAPEALRVWLTVISSDEFAGREVFTPGLDKAAAYIADRLREAGVRPAGDEGTYLQKVYVQTVQSINQSTMTVEVNGESRQFRNGEDVFFQPDVGARRIFTIEGVEFSGYGLNLGQAYNDYAGRDVKGKAVLWMGRVPPVAAQGLPAARLLENRNSMAIDEVGAAASISPAEGGRYGDSGRVTSSFVSSQRLDLPKPPSVTVSDEVLEFMLSSSSSMTLAELRQTARRGESLPAETLPNVKVTFNLDAEYSVISTRETQNVVGIVDGSDPQLRNTFVAFGAHYDHLGTDDSTSASVVDRIHNGADDDGSGSAALIGLAHAFMNQPPRRSLLFAWHAGEERGLWGSQYLVDHSPVPIDNIVAQLNIDMIGRNRDNRDSEENTVYAIGADRISTDLHNVLIDADAALSPPLDINFEMNDGSDAERIYFRSDHYSYAAKGIPIIFFFTGLHPDYHQVTDSIEKIHFQKMSRIARLAYETGKRLANTDQAPVRDFKGPRAGRGSSGKLTAP
jgi:hypothetical protein